MSREAAVRAYILGNRLPGDKMDEPMSAALVAFESIVRERDERPRPDGIFAEWYNRALVAEARVAELEKKADVAWVTHELQDQLQSEIDARFAAEARITPARTALNELWGYMDLGAIPQGTIERVRAALHEETP